MKRTYQTKVQKKSEEEEKKKEKREKYQKAADDYKRCKFKNIRQAALAYDLSYVTLYLQGLLFLSLTFSKDKYYITNNNNNKNLH